MALSDCEKCWNTPCDCGHEYKEWSQDRLGEFIKMLHGVWEDKVAADLTVKKMTVEDGKIEIQLTPGQMQMAHFANSFGEVLKEYNAENYVTMEINSPEYGWLNVTVQKRGGKSVPQDLAELRAKVEEQEKIIAELRNLAK